MRRPRSSRDRGVVVALVAVLAIATLVVAGWLMRAADGPHESRSVTSSPEQPVADDETSVGEQSTAGSPEGFTGMQGQTLTERSPDDPTGPQPLADAGVVPLHVSIPAIEVESDLEDLTTSGGVLQPPVVPESAGWFTGGTVPGDTGPAVIAGHVDSGVAGAVFRDLGELEAGDAIEVTMSDGSLRTFRTTHSRVVSQADAQFPTSDVYGPVPEAQLRLITCHSFDPDRSMYVDNLVVFATADQQERD